jgi:hypothetical protein
MERILSNQTEGMTEPDPERSERWMKELFHRAPAVNGVKWNMAARDRIRAGGQVFTEMAGFALVSRLEQRRSSMSSWCSTP